MSNLRILRRGLAATLVGATAAHAAETAPGNEELLKIIQEQNARIEALAQQLQAMDQSQKQLKTVVLESNQAIADQNKKIDQVDNKLVLPKNLEDLTLKGDLRLRYEQRDRDIAAETANDGDRSRWRTRFRLGAVWHTKDEGWEVGAGVKTGGADGRSANDTWGEDSQTVFESGDIRLDYAYAKHRFTLGEGMPASLTLGQQTNPFVSSMLNWDNDLRPCGVTAQVGDPNDKKYSGLFATTGGYLVDWLSDGKTTSAAGPYDEWDDNVYLYAAQLGYKQVDDGQSWLVALGYQHVTDAYRNSDVWKDSNDPNNVVGGTDTGYNYDIFDLYTQYTTSFGAWELTPYGHAVVNVGAGGDKSQGKGLTSDAVNPEGDNFGWLLGLDATRGKWKLGYGYGYVGSDCVFGPMRDSDFGETAGLRDTDIQGHKLSLAYNFTKNFSVGATAMFLERIGEVADSEASKAQLYQLDATYKF